MIRPWDPRGTESAPGTRSMTLIPLDQHPDDEWGGVRQDVSLHVRRLEHTLVVASPLVRARMRTTDQAVSMTEELGLLGDRPAFIRVSYHLARDFEVLPAAGAMRPGTTEAFRSRFGVPLGASDSSIEAVRSDRRTADTLRVDEATPMLLRELVLTDAEGLVRELSFTHFRSDAVALQNL